MSVHIDYDLLSRTQQKLRTHAARASEYTRTGAWLIADFFKSAHWRVLPVILCGAAQIGLKFAAMGVIYLCVHALSEDLPVAIAGLDALSPQSPTFVIAGVSAGVALLIGTAFFRYQVRRRAIDLGRQYEDQCVRRLFQLASRLPDPRVGLANRIARAGGLRQYFGYTRPCNLAVRQLAELLPTIASFVAVSVALLWMDFWLTMTLAGLAGVAVLAQYPANHRVASASRILEHSRRTASRRYRALLRRLNRDPTPLARDDAILDQFLRSGDVRDNMESFSARALEMESAGLVSRIGSNLLLGTILVLLGIDVVQGDRTWAGVAAYAAAVRFALSDFVSVCKIASGLTKYHAQIANHREFVIDALPCLNETASEAQDVRWPIAFQLPGLHDSSPSLAVHPGAVLAVITPGHASSLLPSLFEGLIACASGDPRWLRPVFVDSELLAPDLDLRANFGLPCDLEETAVAEALARFAPEDEAVALAPPGWLDRSLDELGTEPRWLLQALPVLSVRARGRPLVAMDLAQFAPMARRWQDACRALLADRVLILIHTRPTSVGKYGEQVAILCDGRALRGWVPVPAGRSSRAERRAAKAERRSARAERRGARAARRTTTAKPDQTAGRPKDKTIAQYYAEVTRAPLAPLPDAIDALIGDDLDEYEE